MHCRLPEVCFLVATLAQSGVFFDHSQHVFVRKVAAKVRAAIRIFTGKIPPGTSMEHCWTKPW